MRSCIPDSSVAGCLHGEIICRADQGRTTSEPASTYDAIDSFNISNASNQRRQPVLSTEVLRVDNMATALRTGSLRPMRRPVRYAQHHCAIRVLDASIARRYASTLAVLEQCDGELRTSSLSSIAAANELGTPINAFIAGTKAREAAITASRIPGIEKIIFVDNKAYEKTLPENFAPLLVENIKKGDTHMSSQTTARPAETYYLVSLRS